MKTSVLPILAYAVGFSIAANAATAGSRDGWDLFEFTSLVAFGDSYTDDSRLAYFFSHDGQAPPVGWVDPVNYASADGGRVWAEYVKQYTGANLYNYAVQGAVCSNDITPRYLGAINGDFPAVKQYEIPAYIKDSQYHEPKTGKKFMIDPPDATVSGTNLVSYTNCVYNQLERVYANGGRYFVIQNVAPLNLAPLYGLPGKGGVGDNQYWPVKPKNLTQISYRMMEEVVTVNAIYEYQTPFLVEFAKKYPDARFAVMDMHGLFTDIYNNPSEYLNGTAPLNVTGFIHHCNITTGNCTTLPNPDSYMWYDELHPSEQTERIVAKTFVDVIKGTSKWATYYSDGKGPGSYSGKSR